MSKYKIKPGMKVKFKSWKELVDEFTYRNGYIHCHKSFVEEMRVVCGKIATVKNIAKDGTLYIDFNQTKLNDLQWSYSTDMVIPLKMTAKERKEIAAQEKATKEEAKAIIKKKKAEEQRIKDAKEHLYNSLSDKSKRFVDFMNNNVFRFGDKRGDIADLFSAIMYEPLSTLIERPKG
jgi:hypothetical protein